MKKLTKIRVSMEAKVPTVCSVKRKAVAMEDIYSLFQHLLSSFEELYKRSKEKLDNAQDEHHRELAGKEIQWFKDDIEILTGFLKTIKIRVKTKKVKNGKKKKVAATEEVGKVD